MGQANYKHSLSDRVDAHFKHAWYLAAQQLCRQLPHLTHDREALQHLANQMHSYTVLPEKMAEFLALLQNEAGVTVRFFPHFEKSRIDGAAFWLRPGQPAVVLTNRYDRLDKLWFDLAHELAHVLLHLDQQRQGFVDEHGAEKDQREYEANRQAALWLHTDRVTELLPKGRLTETHAKRRPQTTTLHSIASQLDIHPALVVGTLQHHGIIERSVGNELRPKMATHLPKSLILKPAKT
jgi:HTH-type transcriptional regulator/antitoxin HigA